MFEENKFESTLLKLLLSLATRAIWLAMIIPFGIAAGVGVFFGFVEASTFKNILYAVLLGLFFLLIFVPLISLGILPIKKTKIVIGKIHWKWYLTSLLALFVILIVIDNWDK